MSIWLAVEEKMWSDFDFCLGISFRLDFPVIFSRVLDIFVLIVSEFGHILA